MLVGALLASATIASAQPSRSASGIPDSALVELGAGRFWHATRILRAAGAADGPPAEVLLLARAEAGWHNWPAVRKLLDGASWLDGEGGGEGWRLLGRAREDAGDWQGAAQAYGRYLRDGGADSAGAPAIQARRARALGRAGRTARAVEALKAIHASADPLPSWAAARIVQDRASAGDTAGVREVLPLVMGTRAARLTWRSMADARLAAGDTAGAERAFHVAMKSVTGSRRGTARVELGLLKLSDGDTTVARSLLLEGLHSAGASARPRAAAALLGIASPGLRLSVELATILNRGGNGADALRAYDRAVSLAKRSHVRLRQSVRLARARLMATVRSRQGAAIREFRALSRSRNRRIGATSLEVWAALRRRQGRRRDVKTLRRWLLQRYPSSPQALEVRWTRADDALDRGHRTAALNELAAIEKAAPTSSRAGDAHMRAGQIEIGLGHLRRASRIFHDYLRAFPNGRHWEEASYWAARVDAQSGDSAGARVLVSRIRRTDPVSYYAVMGARLLGEPFRVSVPKGVEPTRPAWLEAGLHELDLLEQAGLDDGADAEVAHLEARAAGSTSATLSLARGLIHRGRTVDGINLGWKLRAGGHRWDLELLKVVYPFPYRGLVVKEAAEWNIDPFLLAALIRQESAFDPRIVSSAGAVGLMQLMLPTGKALARQDGPEDLSAENLTSPEVNLHLGAAFLVEMDRRYHGDLPLVLSAYNAGPTRASRWSRYPEAKDLPRFVERIPFAETRGYVKNIQRNLSVYQALYDTD